MATTSFLLNEFTGSDAQVRVTLTDAGTDTVQVALEVVSGYIADTVGFFAIALRAYVRTISKGSIHTFSDGLKFV